MGKRQVWTLGEGIYKDAIRSDQELAAAQRYMLPLLLVQVTTWAAFSVMKHLEVHVSIFMRSVFSSSQSTSGFL